MTDEEKQKAQEQAGKDLEAQEQAGKDLEAQQAACAKHPAIAVNRYHIAVGKNHVRLAFMELTPPYGWCRCAVVMDRSDAIALANSLLMILNDGGTAH